MSRTISKVAKEIGINIETIRFYERKGLIEQPIKPIQGYRHYPDETINRIRFIRRSQELGFTLNEIEGLLSLNDSPCNKVQELAQKKLIAVQKKQNDLLLLEKALLEHLSQCKNNKDNTHCPIIDSLQPKL
ncbi:transcriptional regulator, MerR family [Colwellia chukchiensis]|uniref:Mercuric resistance operon regulatory protein n=1 Tax=Colwellia chukchiensis TaxID=641665 RepID=A0A1H7I344_9GAMM|nr:Hg(II)-responsive transcriptional regulator [Colwellia chukchiensis]SEK56247.1 transcriptional regulator, MerR family [Colwellia chukchiensis]